MLIKVCGMRDKDNIRALADVSPDFMGTIFYKRSKRYISPSDLEFPDNFAVSNIQWVGVFVNESLNDIISIASDLGLDYLQLHGDENLNYIKSIHNKGLKIIKAFPVDESFDFNHTKVYEPYCNYFLFDTRTPNYGGSGRQFNWNILDRYNGETSFFLSGGVTLQDVNTISKINHPQMVGVDINSRFEKEPGVKDIELIKKFKERI